MIYDIVVLTICIFVCALCKAAKDSVLFYPTQSFLAKKWPSFWGANNWRWVYKNGNPNNGRKYSFVWQILQTPFRSGWHLADSIFLFTAISTGIILGKLNFWLIPILWISIQCVFTVLWTFFKPKQTI